MYPKLHFNELENEKEEIEYSIVTKKEFILYGVGIKTTYKTISHDAPIHFKNISEKYESRYGEIPYGMVTYEKRFFSDKFEYWVLYDKEIQEKEFVKYVIPASKWLVFKIPSQKAETIQKMSKKFYEKFLPSIDFSLNTLPELEYYHDGITEFLVPIENK